VALNCRECGRPLAAGLVQRTAFSARPLPTAARAELEVLRARRELGQLYRELGQRRPERALGLWSQVGEAWLAYDAAVLAFGQLMTLADRVN
jgi:hypothetical protein